MSSDIHMYSGYLHKQAIEHVYLYTYVASHIMASAIVKILSVTYI